MILETKLKCPECSSENTAKMGKVPTRQGSKQRYRCNSCGRTFYNNDK